LMKSIVKNLVKTKAKIECILEKLAVHSNGAWKKEDIGKVLYTLNL